MERTKTLRKTKKTKPASSDFKKLKLLITVVNRSKTEFYADLLSGFEVNFQTALLGRGTAGSDMLHILGLADSDKSVLCSFIREDRAEEAMRALEEKFRLIKNGKGIAFTVPLSSVIGVAIYRFLSNNKS